MSEQNENKNGMVQVSGLWLNESKSGKKFMKGYMGNLTILIFANEYKTSDGQPDFVMYFAQKDYDKKQDKKENPFDGLPI